MPLLQVLDALLREHRGLHRVGWGGGALRVTAAVAAGAKISDRGMGVEPRLHLLLQLPDHAAHSNKTLLHAFSWPNNDASLCSIVA